MRTMRLVGLSVMGLVFACPIEGDARPQDIRQRADRALGELKKRVAPIRVERRPATPEAPKAQPEAAPVAKRRTPERICRRKTGSAAIRGIPSDSTQDEAQRMGPDDLWVKFLFDDEFLYISGDVSRTRSSRTSHTSYVAIALKPREFGLVTYRLTFGKSTKLYGGKLVGSSRRTGRTWDSKARLFTRPQGRGWSFRIRIPFASFGLGQSTPPFRGDVWLCQTGLIPAEVLQTRAPGGRRAPTVKKLFRTYLIFEDRNLLANGDFEMLPSDTQEPPPEWTVQPARTELLAKKDVLDWAGLCSSLSSGATGGQNLAGTVWDHLAPVQSAIEAVAAGTAPNADTQELIVNALNDLPTLPDFCQAEHVADADIDEAQEILDLDRPRTVNETKRLNRLLLEKQYKPYIARGRRDGRVRIATVPDAPNGSHVARLHMAIQPGTAPSLYVDYFPIEPGATYEFSAFVKATQPFYAWASWGRDLGKEWYHPGGQRLYPASPSKFTKVTGWYRCDPRVNQAAVTFRFEGRKGTMWVDRVQLVRVNDLARCGHRVRRAHPTQNLIELSRRTGFKPLWRLKGGGGWYESDRAVFKDTGTGATIWKMSRSPDYACRHRYTERPPWNCDGKWILLSSLARWWRIIMEPDGSAWKPFFVPVPSRDSEGNDVVYLCSVNDDAWDQVDPNTVWARTSAGVIRRCEVDEGGGSTSVWLRNFYDEAPLDPVTGEKRDLVIEMGSVSRDGTYLMLHELVDGRKRWTESRLHLQPTNPATGDAVTISANAHVGQFWFTNRDDGSFFYSHKRPELDDDGTIGGEYGELDPRSGEYTRIKPVYYLTGMGRGHTSFSPSGKWQAHTLGFVYDWLTEETKWVSDHVNTHQSWGPDDTWFIASGGRDPELRRFGVRPRFDQLLGWSNTGLEYEPYSAQAQPVVSPDGTKLGYASNMLGWIDFYVIVMRLPQAPEGLRIRRNPSSSREVVFGWRRPEHHREVAAYRLYRSSSMAGPYRPFAVVPATRTTYRTKLAPGPYFVVTAQEHSGLESLYSNVVSRAAGAAMVCLEAESAHYPEKGSMSTRGEPHPIPVNQRAIGWDQVGGNEEVFDPAAANLYAVLLGSGRPSRGLTFSASLPRGRALALLARVKGLLFSGQGGARLRTVLNDKELGTTRVIKPIWHWVSLGRTRPTRPGSGLAMIKLVPETAGVLVDQVIVTSDPDAVPTRFWGKDHHAPGPVVITGAKPLDPYAVRLEWSSLGDNDTAHYNVYANRGSTCEPGNETLIASPPARGMTDWGLTAGTTYAYRVTAVDRAGNEGEPSPTVVATTLTLGGRVFAEAAITATATVDDQVELQAKFPAVERDCEALFWVELKCKRRKPQGALLVSLDETNLLGVDRDGAPNCFSVPIHFITTQGALEKRIGKKLWVCIQKRIAEDNEGKERFFSVPQGESTLRLISTSNPGLEIHQAVMTNDLGWTPPGVHNFLPYPKPGAD